MVAAPLLVTALLLFLIVWALHPGSKEVALAMLEQRGFSQVRFITHQSFDFGCEVPGFEIPGATQHVWGGYDPSRGRKKTEPHGMCMEGVVCCTRLRSNWICTNHWSGWLEYGGECEEVLSRTLD